MSKFVKLSTYNSEGKKDCEMVINTDAIIRVLPSNLDEKVKLYFCDGTPVIIDIYTASELGIKF